jgi:hypothetical protein
MADLAESSYDDNKEPSRCGRVGCRISIVPDGKDKSKEARNSPLRINSTQSYKTPSPGVHMSLSMLRSRTARCEGSHEWLERMETSGGSWRGYVADRTTCNSKGGRDVKDRVSASELRVSSISTTVEGSPSSIGISNLRNDSDPLDWSVEMKSG